MSEFEVTGFSTRQELLEYQVKDQQKFMTSACVRIAELEAELSEARKVIELSHKEFKEHRESGDCGFYDEGDTEKLCREFLSKHPVSP